VNTAEKLAAVYLRLNGFLLLPHFTLFNGNGHNHVDLIGFRPGSSFEEIFGAPALRDTELSEYLTERMRRDSDRRNVGIIAQVKGNSVRDRITQSQVEYVQNFFGGIEPVCLTFSLAAKDFGQGDHDLKISLGHAHNWIQRRVTDLENRGRLTKIGSWELSEEFLGDLLFLRQINPPQIDTTQRI
jgi:hypothetical protein